MGVEAPSCYNAAALILAISFVTLGSCIRSYRDGSVEILCVQVLLRVWYQLTVAFLLIPINLFFLF